MLFAGNGRLEACSTIQHCSDFGVRDKPGAAQPQPKIAYCPRDGARFLGALASRRRVGSRKPELAGGTPALLGKMR